MTPETNAAERYVHVGPGTGDDQSWAKFWQLRDAANVYTTVASSIVSQCPLLSAERADAVAIPGGMKVPSRSAWVPMELNLADFQRSSGVLEEATLHAALKRCVDNGDAVHDSWCWATPDIQHDSWLNRRLAISVTGFGDVIRRMRLAPDEHASLRFLNQLLLGIRATLYRRSRELAERSEPLPAISLSDPSLSLPRGNVREDWHRRWRESVVATQVRHRNLLVLSPWSLFPSGEAAGYRYTELLPLLRHADACAYHRKVSISHWTLSEFKRFHQRLIAVLQQRGATSRFAQYV